MNYTQSEWQCLLDAEQNGSPDDDAGSEVTTNDNRSFGKLLLSTVVVIGIAFLGIMLSAGG